MALRATRPSHPDLMSFVIISKSSQLKLIWHFGEILWSTKYPICRRVKQMTMAKERGVKMVTKSIRRHQKWPDYFQLAMDVLASMLSSPKFHSRPAYTKLNLNCYKIK